MPQGSSLLTMVAINTTHNGGKSGLMATTLIHWGLLTAGPYGMASSLSTFTSSISHFLTQAELQVWELALGMQCPLRRYYPVSTDLPPMTPFLWMRMGHGGGLHHPFPTVLLLSGTLGLAIPLDPR